MHEVVDVAIPLGEGVLPIDYREALWQGLIALLPWLGDDPGVGVHPIRGAGSGQRLLLPRRARLVLRVRRARVAGLAALAGRSLVVGEQVLRLGAPVPRELEPYPTLAAAFVASGADDDLGHHETIAAWLEERGLSVRFICGTLQRRMVAGESRAGSSVVAHDLREPEAGRLLVEGLGEARHLGYGLFVPAKRITGIE